MENNITNERVSKLVAGLIENRAVIDIEKRNIEHLNNTIKQLEKENTEIKEELHKGLSNDRIIVSNEHGDFIIQSFSNTVEIFPCTIIK